MFFSFLVPKISTTTSNTISQCQMLMDPTTFSFEGKNSGILGERFGSLRRSALCPGARPAHHVQVQVLARETAGQEGVELARQNARLTALAAAGGGRSMD